MSSNRDMYRSDTRAANSSSDNDSDGGIEDTPLWRQKQEKFHRQKNAPMACSSGPDIKRDVNTASSLQRKRSNNVWGSVLTEQDLTQTLVRSGHVETNSAVDFSERDVESYDFTKKYDDPRPEITEEVLDNESTDMKERDIFTAAHPVTVSGRSIIDYEDTVSKSSVRSAGRKRKAEDDGNTSRRTGGVHDRLGAKKMATMRLGDIDIAEDMDQSEAVHKIAEFLHEAKVELIERVVSELGLPVTLRILRATRDVEEGGGMYTMDGSRRRTPGGVFIQLLKQQPEFTSDVKKVVFKEDIEERNKERNDRRKKYRKQKKKSKGGNAGDKQQNSGESRSRSNSGQRSRSRGSNSNNDEMEEGEIDKDMECENEDKGDGRHNSRSRGGKYHGHRRSRSGDNRRSRRKPRYNDLDSMPDGGACGYSDDGSEGEDNRGSGRRKSWSNSKAAPVFDFEAELAAARKQIASKKAAGQSGDREGDKNGENGEAQESAVGSKGVSHDSSRDDDMEAAEANVVEVPLDME